MNLQTTVDAVPEIRGLLLARADQLGIGAGGPETDRIETLLEREIRVPDPTPEECRRHYDAHPERFSSGALVEAAHILFAVTPGVDIAALMRQAESTLHYVAEHPEEFEKTAGEFSNCPSGRSGGRLGQLGREDVVPEMREALFADTREGLLPTLVRTRFGLHVVRVDRRIPGRLLPFDQVSGAIAARLAGDAWETAARQYVEMLLRRREAGDGGVVSPLVQ